MPSRLPHLPSLQPQTLARLTGPVNVLLVLLLAYLLAGVTAQLLPAPQPQAAVPVAAADSPDAAAPGNDYRQLIGWQLFGTPRQTAAPAPVNAPPTRLNLHLGGIIYRDGGAPPLALIAVADQPQKVYRIGDTLAGARIQQIQPERVLLARAGHLETLELPHGNDDLSPAPATSGSTGQVIHAAAIAAQLRHNPSALQDLAAAMPYMRNGRFVGLRLQPGQDGQLLGELGLQSGDVLVALDGQRLTSPSQGLARLQRLLNAPRIEATVLRDGTEVPLTFVLQ